MREFDVVIIGAGTAGLSARKQVAAVTDNYAVIDDGPLGTTCARVGCMPSKVLIQVANDYHRLHGLHEVGIEINDPKLDSVAVMAHVRSLRDRFVKSVQGGMEGWQKTHLIRKRARFVDSNTLDLGDEQVRAKKIIIATGSIPIWPKSFQPYQQYLMNTDDIFELPSLPKSMAVIGMGVIGTELGQAISRLGCKVTGFNLRKSFGGLSHPDLQDYAAKTFGNEIDLVYGDSQILDASENHVSIEVNGKRIEVEKALISLGRRPALDGLGLDKLSIDFNDRGVPLYDCTTFQVHNQPIYLAGDVVGHRPLLHEASDEGNIAGYNAVRPQDQCFRRRHLLAITFSEPNIAVVGSSYAELTKNKIDFVMGKVSFEGQGRSIVMRREGGLLHIYADKDSGKILGAELIAPHGEHLAHLLAWVMSLDLSLKEVLSLPYYHPVVEEGLRTAFRDLAQKLNIKASGLELLTCQDPPAGA